MSMRMTRCRAGKCHAGRHRRANGAIIVINGLAVNRLRGDSAANNFRLKM